MNKNKLQQAGLVVLLLCTLMISGHAAKQQPGKMMKRTIQLVKQDLEKADSFSRKLLRLDTAQNSDTLLSKANMLRGIVTYHKEHYRLSNYYYKQAFKTDYGSTDTQFLAEVWNNMAVNYQSMEQYDSAFLFYTKSLPYKKHLGDTLSVANTRLNLATLENRLGHFRKSDSFIREALPYLRHYNDSQSIGYAYQNLGNNRVDQGRNKEAIAYYRKALSLFQSLNNKHSVLELYKNLATQYQATGRYERSLKILDTLDQLLSTYPEPSTYFDGKLVRVEDLMMLGKTSEAGAILEKLADKKAQMARHGMLQNFYLALMRWHSAKGNKHTYNQIREKYRNRKDSLQHARLKQKTAEMRVLHQVDKKNALLNKQEKVIAVKSNRNQVLTITLFIVIGLLIALLILYLKNKRLWAVIRNLNLLSIGLHSSRSYNGNGTTGKQLTDINLEGSEELFQQVEQLVKEQAWYQYKNLSVKMLAQELGTNELYISRSINKHSGMNFNSYINQYRIHVAKQLLLEKGQETNSISEIGYEVGLPNPSTFSRTFKKLTGFSPSEFYNLKTAYNANFRSK